MRQPLTASGALSVINSLVETSNMQKEIIEWKHNNLPEDDDNNNENGGKKKISLPWYSLLEELQKETP
jgi:hypothetical protein